MPCKPENKSYLDAYQVEIAKVKQSNPSLSDHDTRILGAQLYRLKFPEWKASAKKEGQGEKYYENGEFALNENGEMYFPRTGETAEGLHVNQKILSELPGHRPEEYSQEDHQLTRLIQKTIHEGARRVVTSFGRNDGNNRDILEYNYNPVTNKGTIRVLNTESDGQLRSIDELKQVATEKYAGLHEVSPSKEMFILTDKPITQDVAVQVVNGVGYAAKQTASEAGYTARSVVRYFEKRQEQKSTPLIPGLIQRDPKTKDIWVKLMRLSKEKLLVKRQHTPHELTINKVHVRKRKSEQVGQRRVKETDPMHMFVSGRTIEGRWEEPESKVTKKPNVRHERKGKNKTKRIELIRRALSQIEHRVEKRKEKMLKIQIKKKSERRILFVETKQLKTRIVKKERLLRKRIEKISKERAVRLLTVVKKLIQIRERIQQARGKRLEKAGIGKIEKRRNAQEHILNFQIAIIFWLVLAKPKNILMNEYKHSKKENKGLILKEPTPWLLLAIIWHLAMIRESGTRTTQVTVKPKKVKAKAYYPRFAPQGVIFAFAA